MQFTQSIALNISPENEALIGVIAENMGYKQNEDQTAQEFICMVQDLEARQQLTSKVSIAVYSYFGKKEEASANAVIEALKDAITITSSIQ